MAIIEVAVHRDSERSSRFVWKLTDIYVEHPLVPNPTFATRANAFEFKRCRFAYKYTATD